MQVRAIFREPARLFQLTSVPENVNVTIGYLARDVDLQVAMVATQRAVSVLPYICSPVSSDPTARWFAATADDSSRTEAAERQLLVNRLRAHEPGDLGAAAGLEHGPRGVRPALVCHLKADGR